MIPIRTDVEVQSQFVDSVNNILERFEQVKERYKDQDETTKGHYMFKELSYWFHNNGQLNKF